MKRPNFKTVDGIEGIFCKSCGMGGRFEINTELWLEIDEEFTVYVYGFRDDYKITCSNCNAKMKAPDEMLQSIHNSFLFLQDMITGMAAQWPANNIAITNKGETND